MNNHKFFRVTGHGFNFVSIAESEVVAASIAANYCKLPKSATPFTVTELPDKRDWPRRGDRVLKQTGYRQHEVEDETGKKELVQMPVWSYCSM